jgi:uncharacterized protein (DUF433 family)
LSNDVGVVQQNTSLLERPVYGVAEAAGLLGLRTDRVRAWLDGYRRGGVSYPAVIRLAPTNDEIVTWGEFVELGYLREYRRSGVPLQRLRPVIDELRRAFGTPYPLATVRPFVLDRELVLEVQDRLDIPAAIAIVIRSGQQVMLTEVASRFFRKAVFDDKGDLSVTRLHPAGAASPVTIDPLVRFGLPAVDGVATERLWELFDAGETVEQIESGYDLTGEAVRAAIAYEEQLRSLVA